MRVGRAPPREQAMRFITLLGAVALATAVPALAIGQATTDHRSSPRPNGPSTAILNGLNFAPGVVEPATWGLVGIGFCAIGAIARRRRVAVVAD
jgi:hypothetical protein